MVSYIRLYWLQCSRLVNGDAKFVVMRVEEIELAPLHPHSIAVTVQSIPTRHNYIGMSIAHPCRALLPHVRTQPNPASTIIHATHTGTCDSVSVSHFNSMLRSMSPAVFFWKDSHFCNWTLAVGFGTCLALAVC